jgi:catechol 2,3-dioxygenase-like lactoylglutathione lyase family enzyme
MKFGYTILYVKDVEKTVAFYESAFGLKRKFVNESGYGEMDTGHRAGRAIRHLGQHQERRRAALAASRNGSARNHRGIGRNYKVAKPARLDKNMEGAGKSWAGRITGIPS